MFLKVPEGFQRKKISSCADTLLLPCICRGEGVTVYNVASVWTLATMITRVTQFGLMKVILSDTQNYSSGTEGSLLKICLK